MADPVRISPDHDFISLVRKQSGSALQACMQCGSCSAVCELAGPDRPFPRKEMKWASWGMKEKLLGNPDLWICHHCGDCTRTCPRGVKPGEVLDALRKINYAHYARPALLHRWISSPAYLPLLILFPALVIAGILSLAGTLIPPAGPVHYASFFPHAWLNGTFSTLVLIFAAGLASGTQRFWKDMRRLKPAVGRSNLLPSLWKVLKDIFLHRSFSKCTENRYRNTAHLLVFWGFVSLLVVTLFAIVSAVFFEYPLPLTHPVKILGNLAGALLCTGCVIMMWEKWGKGEGDYTDWFFLVTLFLLGLSGYFVEAGRFLNWRTAYLIYFTHLVLVWLVIMYFPFTRLVHFLYRFLALTWNEYAGYGNIEAEAFSNQRNEFPEEKAE